MTDKDGKTPDYPDGKYGEMTFNKGVAKFSIKGEGVMAADNCGEQNTDKKTRGFSFEAP